MYDTFSGIMIFVNSLQELNAAFPMYDTFPRIVIIVNDEQELNA